MRPTVEVDQAEVKGPWRWTTRHPRTGMVLRTGRAGSKRRARARAKRSADGWVKQYAHLQGDQR